MGIAATWSWTFGIIYRHFEDIYLLPDRRDGPGRKVSEKQADDAEETKKPNGRRRVRNFRGEHFTILLFILAI